MVLLSHSHAPHIPTPVTVIGAVLVRSKFGEFGTAVTLHGFVAPTATLKARSRLAWPPRCAPTHHVCLRGAGCGASKPSEAGEKAPAPSSAPPKLEEPAKPKPAPEEPAKPKPAPEEPTKPAAEEPKPVPALAPDVPAAKWWEAELPDVVVVRKEVRKMPRAEQERVAAAVNKMRENDGGKKGS